MKKFDMMHGYELVDVLEDILAQAKGQQTDCSFRSELIKMLENGLESESFPIEKVAEITGFRRPSGTNINYCTLNSLCLQKLVECGAAKPDQRQNYSPSIAEFLDLTKDVSEKVNFESYIVYPPRSDARVSVEGVNFSELTADECDDLAEKFKDADALDYYPLQDGSFRLSAWWD